MNADRFRTHTLRDERILRVLASAIQAVEPGKLTRHHLQRTPLPPHRRLFLLGVGKAAEAMTFAASQFLDRVTDSLVITKHASRGTSGLPRVIESGHPVPDERSLAAGRAALEFASKLNEDDLLLCLISGGGSALMTYPRPGISLDEMQQLTSSLLASGAAIHEINAIRRQLDQIKGGGLARRTKARVLGLILSDVPGNSLKVIASGPTVQSKAAPEEGMQIIKKYSIQVTPGIRQALMGQIPYDESLEKRVQNIIIGDLHTAAQTAQRQAAQEGFDSSVIDLNLQGEAREAGLNLAKKLKQEREKKKGPFCLIAGGETTVTLHGNGKGGRNQELALSAVDELSGVQDLLFVSLATDGDDGPTDAAGAVVNGETRQRAERLGMSAADYLSGNDAYGYFDPLNDLIKCGHSGTNVNDLVFLLGL